MLRKLRTTLGALIVVALAIPAVAEAESTIDLPKRGKLTEWGHVALTITYSCPATISPDEGLLWLYTSQEATFAAGDTAQFVTCNGKRRKYRIELGPNVGERYVAGTVSVQAYLGNYGPLLASDSANIIVR
jgi:hypothetical protein